MRIYYRSFSKYLGAKNAAGDMIKGCGAELGTELGAENSFSSSISLLLREITQDVGAIRILQRLDLYNSIYNLKLKSSW